MQCSVPDPQWGAESLGETKAATEACLAPVPVYAAAPPWQVERKMAWPTQGPASGAHGAWAPMSLVCALQSWGPPRKGLAGGESQKGSESGNKVQGARLGAGCGEGRGEGRGPADTKLHGSMRLRRGEGRGRLMRPRGGERGVPGVPGAERDIPGGGETVPPMRVQEGHRVRQPPPPRCQLAHCSLRNQGPKAESPPFSNCSELLDS